MTQLPAFVSRTNLKLYISIPVKLVTNFITELDFSKESDIDCISMVFLNKCGPELSHKLTEHFNNSLKESCFWDCCKI